jgi:hypothetical protein
VNSINPGATATSRRAGGTLESSTDFPNGL